jgi:eukaryotic-like serine/threonine-protein kinase
LKAGALTNHTIADYQLLELLGEGAIGSVYHGYNPHRNQHAAVKILTNPTSTPHPNDVERFILEARTVASLQHPHIVPLYDYGTDKGFYFIAMRLFTGGSLHDWLEASLHQGVLPSLGEVRQLIRQLASALDYAHRKNVIHRDVKPTNVMFDEHGTAYLVDFGIVKLTDVATWLTQHDMMVGTPAYMAPEQWRGEAVTPATDQYALGVMAYQLISGQIPFDAPSHHVLMYKHINEHPIPISELRPDIPPAIQQVLQTALAKNPGERYPSITTFAEALSHAIHGAEGVPTVFSIYRPLLRVAPTPTLYRPKEQPSDFLKPLMIGMGVGAVFLVVCTLSVLFTGLRVFGENDDELILPTAIEEITAPPDAATITPLPLSVIQTATATIAPTPLPLSSPVNDIQQIAAIDAVDNSIRAVEFHPSGAVFASGGSNGTIQIWDANSKTQLASLNGHNGVIYDLTYDHDGSRLASASADGTVRLWDGISGQSVAVLSGHTGDVRRVVFSPDGSLLASTGQDKTVRLWDVAGGTQLAVFEASNERVLGAVFSLDGTTLITGWDSNTLAIWNIASLNQRTRLIGHTGEIRAIAFSPRKNIIASSSSDNTVRVWNVETGETLLVLSHQREVFNVAFSPDGAFLASGSADNQIYLWNVETGVLVSRLEGHFGWVFDMSFHPNGSLLVSAGGDGMLRLWHLFQSE